MPHFFNNLTLLELFDNLLVATLICCCFLLIKREISLRIALLLLILIAGQTVCRAFGLSSTATLFQMLLSSMPFILAVIFQSDIKRLFFSLGKRRAENMDAAESAHSVDELIRGLHELADRRIGALIVIIRQMSIDHLIQVGTEIDAKVTSELLNSIFLPYSPIHDGAVILQRDKIISAGCILPLSQNPDISKSFGTRHRAALGISEQTDVLVLVVSEETGKISIVHEGKITYDADPTEIRRLSRKAIEGRRAPRQPS
ncbi:MAG TPA: TIGR00159 family protein [Desulfuromonadales bacterium]|nr:TIGR00159 family protein [Desulfuromonadales bacterium]